MMEMMNPTRAETQQNRRLETTMAFSVPSFWFRTTTWAWGGNGPPGVGSIVQRPNEATVTPDHSSLRASSAYKSFLDTSTECQSTHRALDDPDDFCVDTTTYPGTVSILFSLAKQRKLQMKEVRNLGECADKWDCSVNSPKKFKPATDSRCEGFPTAADYIAKVAFSGITACHELPPNAKEAKPGMPMEMLPPSSLKEALESMAERDSSTWPRCSDVLSVAMQYNRQHAGGISGGGQPATEAGGGGEAEPVPVRNGFLQHAMDHAPFGLGFSSEMHDDWVPDWEGE